jgi:hypothetical protein
MPALRARESVEGVNEVKGFVVIRRASLAPPHQSGFLFLLPGSVSQSQNMLVAAKAVDAADIRIDPMATLLTCSAFSSATSWRTRLQARGWEGG